MIKIVLIMVFVLYGALAGKVAANDSSDRINDYLFRLYVELKCPNWAYVEPKKKGAYACLNSISYFKDDDLVDVYYNVYENHPQLKDFKIMSLSKKKETMARVLQIISGQLSLGSEAEKYPQGYADIVPVSNYFPINNESALSLIKMIKKKSVISAVFELDGMYYQSMLLPDGRVFHRFEQDFVSFKQMLVLSRRASGRIK